MEEVEGHTVTQLARQNGDQRGRSRGGRRWPELDKRESFSWEMLWAWGGKREGRRGGRVGGGVCAPSLNRGRRGQGAWGHAGGALSVERHGQGGRRWARLQSGAARAC